MSDSAGRSLFWVAVESGGMSFLSLVMLLIVARVIGPEEFGTVAIVLGIVQMLFILADTLLHDAIVQRRFLSSKHLDTAFWTCTSVGFLLSLFCWLGSNEIARLFQSPMMAQLLSVAGISLAFGGLGAVPLAALRRERKFRPIAIRSLYARLTGAMAALLMLALDYGVWSLIVQYIIQIALNSVMIWPALTWRPRLRFSSQRLLQLLLFGFYAVGSRIVWISSARIFMIFVGYFIGVTAAGILNMAQRVVETLYDALSGAAYNLALPYFSKHQNDRIAMTRMYHSALNFAALVTFPLFLGLMICAPSIVEVALGRQWLEAVPLVGVLAVATTFHFIVLFAEVAVMALGRPGIVFLSSLLSFLLAMVSFVVVWPDSAFEASVLWACRTLLSGPVILIVANRMLGTSGWNVIKSVAAPGAAALVMVGVLSTASLTLSGFTNATVELVFLVGLGAMIYCAAICLFDPTAIRRMTNIFGSGIGIKRD